MEIIESGITFRFPDSSMTVKYDDTKYYRDNFTNVPGAKGVDVLSIQENQIVFLEIKNCKGHEGENRWRIGNNNSKLHTASIIPESNNRESLDIEVAKKITMTLSCLMGLNTNPEYQEYVEILRPYFRFFEGKAIARGEKSIKIILFLEGDFASDSRNEKMILQNIGSSIHQKLSWLNCKVLVENSNTYMPKYYEVI